LLAGERFGITAGDFGAFCVTDPVLFILAVATILGTPGPTNTLLATGGALSGIRRALPLLAGELGGYLVAVFAIRLVLEPVLENFPLVGRGLKIAVALYLVYLAARLWLHRSKPVSERRVVTVPAVFVTTLLNPKAIIFALSVLPFGHPVFAAYLAAFALSVVTAGLLWIAIGATTGSVAGGRLAAWVPVVAALALLVFAGLIGWSAVVG
jgi:threonine/homoserine/homoserine lactone efflux protein